MTPAGWIPIRFFARGGAPRVDWCRAGDAPFIDPFFSQTIEKVLRDPFHLVFRRVTPASVLEGLPPASPSGLVLHFSRCGSTLVARLLGALAGSRVVSEPDPLDSVLRFGAAPEEERVAWLRGLAAAWGAGERRLFVKLDSNSNVDFPLVVRAFPGVPRVFLYRDPLEVLVSNLRQGHFWPQNLVLARRCGISPEGLDEARFGALVLARWLERALEDQARPGTLLVRWEELPEAFFTRVLPHLGAAPTPQEEAAMRDLARSDAKNPSRKFVRDAEGKRREAPAEVRDAVERHARLPFVKLEALREKQLAAGAAR